MPHHSIIHPGATLGVLGGGQLGRMFAQAASKMGYRVAVYAPELDSPAAGVADEHHVHAYDDTVALDGFAKTCAAVTIEFENVPASALERIAERRPVRPGPKVLRIAQDRLLERAFLDRIGAPTAAHVPVHQATDINTAVARLQTPFVIKNATQGYDGRGQARVDHPDRALTTWQQLGGRPALCEAWVDYTQEWSVLVGRAAGGEIRTFGPIENRHVNHVLDLSVTPAEAPPKLAEAARQMAIDIAEALELEGLICVEMFLTRDGSLLVNELAPRPHNSGHLTIEAARTSQFQQQVRALCNLPLGDMTLRQPAAMANLLGEHWPAREADLHAVAHAHPVRLHDYAKRDPRPGRKMGHLTATAPTPAKAAQRVLAARDAIARHACPTRIPNRRSA